MVDTNDDNTPVRPIELEELNESQRGESIVASLDLVRHLKVKLSASLGAAELTVGELMALKQGSVFRLDKETNDPLDVFLGERLVARGTLVVVDDHFGVQITEIAAR